MKELADACRANDVTDLVVLHEHRGVPGMFIKLIKTSYAVVLTRAAIS